VGQAVPPALAGVPPSAGRRRASLGQRAGGTACPTTEHADRTCESVHQEKGRFQTLEPAPVLQFKPPLELHAERKVNLRRSAFGGIPFSLIPGVMKVAGVLWVMVVFTALQLYHLNGL